MKASQFNLTYNYEKYYVLLNTKTKNVVRFPLEQSTLVDEVLAQNSFHSNSLIEEMLFEKGFLVHDNSNELDDIYKECYELVNSEILYLTIMPTYTCNLACVYCFQHHISDAIMDQITEKNIIMAVEKNINNYKALYVEWFGGEPLLAKKQVINMNKKFKEICRCAKVPYASRITTNGFFLDIDTFEQMFKNNCFVYYISIDGGKELHDKQRPCKSGHGSYEVIMRNLSQIKDKVISRNFRIEIRVNCSSHMYCEFEHFLSDFEKKFGKDKRFLLIIETVNDWSDRTKEMRRRGQLLTHSNMSELGKIAHKYNISLASMDKHSLKTQMCQAGKRNAYSIFYDGTIHKCQMALESDEYRRLDTIGKVTDNGEFDIEREKESIWVKDFFPKSCEKCRLLPMCLGKKCIYQKEIQGYECEGVEEKFLDIYMAYDASKLENIPLFFFDNYCTKCLKVNL